VNGRLALLLGLALVAACSGEEIHRGHGVVEQVLRDEGQAVIAHDEIQGFMPAMTMNFAIYDKEVLADLAAGDVVDFDLTVSRGQFYISKAVVVGKVDADSGWAVFGDKAVRADPAPDFALIDQRGEVVSLESLRGKIVLLDFIFTRCPGPCPILTSTHASAERLLSPELRARTHFVSISIDPLRDTPEDMARYGAVRGADLEHWSFLTGAPPVVEAVVAAYGIGTTRNADGELEHIVATFLIDRDGRIVRRYLGLDHEPRQLVAELEAAAAGE
jgi:protein SCO1/2